MSGHPHLDPAGYLLGGGPVPLKFKVQGRGFGYLHYENSTVHATVFLVFRIIPGV